MKVHIEKIYHYLCDHCKKWWSIADIKPKYARVICPHCCGWNHIDNFEEHEIKDEELNGDPPL